MSEQNKDKVVRRNRKSPSKKNTRKKTKDKPKWTWQRGVFLLAVFVFVGIVIYIFLFSPLIEVNDIEVNGVSDEQEQEQIRRKVSEAISGELVGGVARNNYLFINKSNVINSVLEDKQIKEVSVTKQFPQTIIIDATKYDTLAIWCLQNINGKCFLVEDGVVKKEITLDSDIVAQNKHFILVEEGNDNVEIEERVISPENLDKIRFLGEELKYVLSANIEQPYLVLSRGSNEVKFFTDEGWYLLVDVSQNSDDIIDTIKLFFSKVSLPNSRVDLEYLDMRFPEKIFYKMRNEVQQNEEDTESLSEMQNDDG